MMQKIHMPGLSNSYRYVNHVPSHLSNLTFSAVLLTLNLYITQDENMLKEGQHVTLVQSGSQPIWREESTHLIQVRKIKIGG